MKKDSADSVDLIAGNDRVARRRLRTPIRAVTIASLLLAAAAQAGSFQSLDSIRAAVKRFLVTSFQNAATKPNVTVGRLDTRLRLAACSQPLRTFDPRHEQKYGPVIVGVRCNGPKPWTLYVPATVNSYSEVMALARPLGRGTIIKRGDLQPVRENLARLPYGYFTDPKNVVGMELRRPMGLGAILTPSALAEPQLVKRGDDVTLIAEGNGVQVTIKAQAMDDGAKGDQIRVKNLSSERIVDAQVAGHDFVKIDLSE